MERVEVGVVVKNQRGAKFEFSCLSLGSLFRSSPVRCDPVNSPCASHDIVSTLEGTKGKQQQQSTGTQCTYDQCVCVFFVRL